MWEVDWRLLLKITEVLRALVMTLEWVNCILCSLSSFLSLSSAYQFQACYMILIYICGYFYVLCCIKMQKLENAGQEMLSIK